jgi:hypothetical protein
MSGLTTKIRSNKIWKLDPEGNPRGYIQPRLLKELWFHTGTVCNLRCPFCLEGSHPGSNRLYALSLDDVKPFIQEASALLHRDVFVSALVNRQ